MEFHGFEPPPPPPDLTAVWLHRQRAARSVIERACVRVCVWQVHRRCAWVAVVAKAASNAAATAASVLDCLGPAAAVMVTLPPRACVCAGNVANLDIGHARQMCVL